jgi:hypothetical protein
MNGWKIDKAWSDRFMHEIKMILGLHLISESPEIEDQKHNTDLMVLRLGGLRVGCRVRAYDMFLNPEYRQQFTIRYSRPSGNKTEYEKIMEGWGDYLFYGFAGQTNKSLILWSLIDLQIFRDAVHSQMAINGNYLPAKQQFNKDSSSTFLIFNFYTFPQVKIASGDSNWIKTLITD